VVTELLSSPASSPEHGPGAKPAEVRIQRSALVPQTPERMYALVADVERYPEWFDWCSDGRVLSRDGDTLTAELGVLVAGIRVSFITRNRGTPPSRIELALVSGPFRQLEGHWRFDALGDVGCRVSLVLRFEMGSQWLSAALAMGFRRIVDRMAEDFCRVARHYG
jgi:ribosome-associated toxin RatA of RatAB toxin-antitoxin module